MHSVLIALAATGLASVAHAFTKPGASTWGPLLTPDLSTVCLLRVALFRLHS